MVKRLGERLYTVLDSQPPVITNMTVQASYQGVNCGVRPMFKLSTSRCQKCVSIRLFFEFDKCKVAVDDTGVLVRGIRTPTSPSSKTFFCFNFVCLFVLPGYLLPHLEAILRAKTKKIRLRVDLSDSR